MKKRHWFMLISWLATALWIAFIFGQSMQSGAESGAASDAVTGWVNEALHALFPSASVTEHFIRKLAHFGEFSVLSLLFCLDYVLLCSLHRSDSLGRRALVLLAIPSSALIAAADETVQIFSENRGPSVTDVLIDTAGAAFTALICFGLLCLLRLRRRKPSEKAYSDEKTDR